jgi:tripartite-type tricarboxylate transporter receptor subunit TctC
MSNLDQQDRRHFIQGVGALCVFGASHGLGMAQDRAIKFVVPNPAGGLPDTVARVFAQKLTEKLGQSVIVDNRPGANGMIAAQVLTNGPKDGSVFLVADGSMFSINPHLYKSLSYDYRRDFLPVSLAASAPLYLAVHPRIKANNLRELIAMIKSKPGELTYGSSGVGSTHHLSMEAFKTALSLDIQHIPFKGSGQSVPALIGGQVDMLFSALPSLSGFVKTGQVRLLGNNSAKRSSQEPNVPAIAEILSGYDFSPTIGVFAAAGTPQSVIDKMSAEIAKVARMPETVQTLSNAGVEAVGGSVTEHGKVIASENERFGKAVVAAGIKPE